MARGPADGRQLLHTHYRYCRTHLGQRTQNQAKEFAVVVGDGTTLTFRDLHQCLDPYYIQPDMPARCKSPCHLFGFLSVAEKIGGADPLFDFAVPFWSPFVQVHHGTVHNPNNQRHHQQLQHQQQQRTDSAASFIYCLSAFSICALVEVQFLHPIQPPQIIVLLCFSCTLSPIVSTCFRYTCMNIYMGSKVGGVLGSWKRCHHGCEGFP